MNAIARAFQVFQTYKVRFEQSPYIFLAVRVALPDYGPERMSDQGKLMGLVLGAAFSKPAPFFIGGIE
jgi:hypothetical protein